MVNKEAVSVFWIVLLMQFVSAGYVGHSGENIRGGNLAVDGIDVTGNINSTGLNSSSGLMNILRITGARTYLQGYVGGNHWFSTGAPEPNSLFMSFIINNNTYADGVRIAPRNSNGLFVNRVGYVGINTQGQTRPLSVNGSINLSGVGRLDFPDGTFLATAPAGASGDNLGNHMATQNIRLNSYYLSGDGDNEGVTVSATGNVGIGTNAPTERLDVNGDIFTSGGILLAGVRRTSWPTNFDRYCTPITTTGLAFRGYTGPISLINPATGTNICEDDTGCMILLYLFTDTHPVAHELYFGGRFNLIQDAVTHEWIAIGETNTRGINGDSDQETILSWDSTVSDDTPTPHTDDGTFTLRDSLTSPDEIIGEDDALEFGYNLIVCDY
jgi:hypothetical protein